MNKIIFGGGFDPVHRGHLNMARIASKTFDADVIFVPAVISVWKNSALASFLDRVNMLNIAFHDIHNCRFSVSSYEYETGKEINYTYHTIRHFKEIYPHDKLFLLIGQDQVENFHKWRNAEEISENAQIIFLRRDNSKLETPNIDKYHMIELKGDMVDVSSTETRLLKKINLLDKSTIYYIADNGLYYAGKLKELLKENNYKRYYHSISVANLAYEIAISNNISHPEKAYLAGLLHDCAKYMGKPIAKSLMERHFKEYLDIPGWSYHQFLGSMIAKDEFGVDDKEVLEAIKFHATGKAHMSDIAKIVYAADKIEPSRGYDSSDYINACLEDFEKGFKIVLQANKEYLISKGKDFANRLTMQCFDCYLK